MNDAAESPDDELGQLLEENERLRREVLNLRHFIDALQNLTDAAEGMCAEPEIMELLNQVLDNALQTISASDGSLMVLDDDTGELVFVLTSGALPRERLAWRRLPPGAGVAGWVVANRRATIVNDAQSDDRFYGGLDDEMDFHTKSILAAPLIGGGRVLGVIEVLNKHRGMLFSTADQTLLSLLCRYAGELLHTLVQRTQRAQGPAGASASGA